MDYKIFKLTNNRIIQIASKEKMQKWTGEAPLVYVNYLRNNRLNTYGSKANQKEISQYRRLCRQVHAACHLARLWFGRFAS